MTSDEMMREVIAYAMEETRNRALEEAAQLAQKFRNGSGVAHDIRRLKRDPSLKMTDWWEKKPKYICDMVPEGA